MKHKRVEDTLQAIQPSRLRSLGGGNCGRFRRWDSHRSGVLSSNKLLISRVARSAKIAHSALRMYTVMYTEALAFPQRPIARTPNNLAPMASSFPEVGFEEGLFRRMATQPRVSRSRFLDRETKQGLGRIQHPRKLGSAVTSSRRLSGNWLGYWSQARLSVPIHLGRIPDRRHRCRRTSALPYQGMGPFSSKKPPGGRRREEWRAG